MFSADHDQADDIDAEVLAEEESTADASEESTHERPTKGKSKRSAEGDSDKGDRGAAIAKGFRRALVAVFIIIAVGLVAFFIWTQFLPRWWAQTISRQTGGTFSGGVGWGLIFGFVFTLIPLLFLGLAIIRPWRFIAVRFVFAILGLLIAIPNLITLSISLAPGNSNQIARTTMDVSAPWFRGSTLIGAIIAAVIAAGMGVVSILHQRRKAKVKELEAELQKQKG